MRLPALHSGGQLPALDSDSCLSQLPASGWVAHSAAGLLWSCAWPLSAVPLLPPLFAARLACSQRKCPTASRRA